MPRLTEARRTEKRQHIVRAAIRCVERQGADATSVRDVLDEAGVSAGALYSHFSGREELIAAVAEYLIGAEIDEVAAAPDAQASYAQLVLERPGRLAPALAALRASAAPEAAVQPVIADLNKRLATRIEPMVASRTDDDLALAELCDIVWDGMVRRHTTGTVVTSYERLGRQLLQLLGVENAP